MKLISSWFYLGLIATSLGIFAPSAQAGVPGWDDPEPKAIGLVFGEPTGLSAKYWLTDKRAIAAGMAYSFDDYVIVYADYLWHFPQIIGRSSPWAKQIFPYLGVGAMIYLSTVGDRSNRIDDRDGSAGLAVRLPVGVEWRPNNTPIGVFLELAPTVGLLPSTFGILQGGLGVRYYLD